MPGGVTNNRHDGFAIWFVISAKLFLVATNGISLQIHIAKPYHGSCEAMHPLVAARGCSKVYPGTLTTTTCGPTKGHS